MDRETGRKAKEVDHDAGTNHSCSSCTSDADRRCADARRGAAIRKGSARRRSASTEVTDAPARPASRLPIVYAFAVTENVANFENTPDVGATLTFAWISQVH